MPRRAASRIGVSAGSCEATRPTARRAASTSPTASRPSASARTRSASCASAAAIRRSSRLLSRSARSPSSTSSPGCGCDRLDLCRSRAAALRPPGHAGRAPRPARRVRRPDPASGGRRPDSRPAAPPNSVPAKRSRASRWAAAERSRSCSDCPCTTTSCRPISFSTPIGAARPPTTPRLRPSDETDRPRMSFRARLRRGRDPRPRRERDPRRARIVDLPVPLDDGLRAAGADRARVGTIAEQQRRAR